MNGFSLSAQPIDVAALRAALSHDAAGGVVVFEGVVRDHNAGRAVRGLAYQAYDALAASEGTRIVDEARARHAVEALVCVHRVGELATSPIASAAHRAAAFDAVRWVIDEVKRRVPIWKKERYTDGDSEWLHPSA